MRTTGCGLQENPFILPYAHVSVTAQRFPDLTERVYTSSFLFFLFSSARVVLYLAGTERGTSPSPMNNQPSPDEQTLPKGL